MEWAIRWTLLPENFALMADIADFVRSSMDASGGICTVRMSDFGTPASSRKTFSTATQEPLKPGTSENP
jgi:hypothetical protein